MNKSQPHSDNTLTINLKNIASNYNLIKKISKPSEVSAVVKANAYGLGALKVANHLYETGCKTFFVANLDEAIELRASLKSAQILVFHGIKKSQEQLFHKYNIHPVLNNLEQTTLWESYCKKINKLLPCSVHVDTGMNRLGFKINDIKQNHKSLLNLKPKYILSHMACADEAENEVNNNQLKQFNAARKLFPDSKYSLANSSASFLAKCYHFDLLRPGSALYGVNPSSGKNPVKHVVELKSKIIQLRKIDSLQTVGYGATRKLAKNSRIAVLPIGYADGLSRHLSNCGKVFIKGYKLDIVGRVSMDLITADVTKVPEKLITLGTEVEIIGKNITVDEVAENSGTIGYEVLTSLGNRFKVEYVA